MRSIKLLIGVFFIWNNSHGQHSDLRGEMIGSAFFNSERHANDNGDQNLYYEARIGYEINKYFELNLFAGYQDRSFIYYAKFDNPWRLIPLYMDRRYFPVGVNLRLYLTNFFFEKLKLWKKAGRWDVYNQIGLATIKGKDTPDQQDESYRGQGAYVPYYLVPYKVEYGRLYITYLAGVRYNLGRSIGVFVEGGDAALMNLQIGVSCRF